MQFELTLTATQQRIIALVLFLMPVLSLMYLISSFIISQVQHYRDVARLSHELQLENTLVEHSAEWQKKVAGLRESPIWNDIFSDANLAKRGVLAQLVSESGGTLESTAQKRVDAGGPIQLNEYVTFRADIGSLVSILERLRRSQPLCIVRRLSIQDLEVATGGIRAAPNKLSISLDASCFERPLTR